MSTDQSFVVLLVEDDDLDAEVVRRSFAKQKIAATLERVNNGHEALECLRSRAASPDPFQCILFLDLNMPGVSGHDVLAEVRADASIRKTPVFVLTTSDHERDVTLAYEMNVAGYFTKDRLGELLDVLKSYVNGAILPRL